jgi:hypothetical protein
VQEANRQYDAGVCPAMLDVTTAIPKPFTDYSPLPNKFRDVVDAIFSAPDRDSAMAIIDFYDKFWQAIPGTRGATGKKTVNASTIYSKYYVEDSEDTVQLEDDLEFDDSKLDELEASVHE